MTLLPLWSLRRCYKNKKEFFPEKRILLNKIIIPFSLGEFCVFNGICGAIILTLEIIEESIFDLMFETVNVLCRF